MEVGEQGRDAPNSNALTDRDAYRGKDQSVTQIGKYGYQCSALAPCSPPRTFCTTRLSFWTFVCVAMNLLNLGYTLSMKKISDQGQELWFFYVSLVL